MTSTNRTPRRDADRRRLLDATLPHIVFDGWTLVAMRAGAEDCGMPLADVRRLFPGGGDELLGFFVSEADRTMEEELVGRHLGNMRIRDRIATAVRVRLEQHTEHRDAIRRALALQALPQNGPGGLRALYRTVDAIWYAAGDSATDFNFYTKRLLLSGVYMSTLMFWLDDTSEGAEASWAFLDRRIENVMGIQKLKGRVERWLPSPDELVGKILARRGAGGASPFGSGGAST
ncbi:MAG: COQ9 family protein [Rhodospirillaceae bacterium]|jgi:ubiquinone biosynthesis protein COQ9|nr:COQ9 family protein [Rhodospirillaceae bacterium]MBT6203292.1 COQ9 family protein [Rhodospirillaceae bacterium]MBT7648758.1 COQ9 family protein [Rhodospirillaceae bacterium]